MYLKSFILVFLAVVVHEVIGEFGCPEPEEIAPCTCKESVYTNIQCVGVKEVQTVKTVFDNARRYHFNKFSLINSTLQYIPHEVFTDVEVKFLDFYRVNFVKTFDETPQNPGVEIIALANVRILGGWDWSKLSLFTELKDLTITDVSMKRLSTDFRPNINKNLEKLRLSWCGIKKLRDDEFQEFKELKVFYATHDELATLKRSMFANPSKLEEISFENNHILTLPEDMFIGMEHLRFINLNYNLLTKLPVETYRPVIDHLTYFKLFGNPLRCDCEIQWLTFKKVQYLEGKCAVPLRFFAKDLNKLKPQDFRC